MAHHPKLPVLGGENGVIKFATNKIVKCSLLIYSNETTKQKQTNNKKKKYHGSLEQGTFHKGCQ